MSTEHTTKQITPSDSEKMLLFERLAEHGLSRDDVQRVGARFVRRDGGLFLALAYVDPSGEPIERRLVLKYPKTDARGGWRWANGALAKGAVLKVGDPQSAASVLIVEGESDCLAIARWIYDDSRFAIIAVPGSNMVDGTIANHIGNGAEAIIGTDNDAAGHKCAEDLRQALLDAGHDPSLIKRYVPHLQGREGCDLRDVIESLEDNNADQQGVIEFIFGAAKPFAAPKTEVAAPQPAKSPQVNTQSAGVRTLATVKELPIEWLFPGLVPRRALTLLVGAGGYGKTTLALKLAALVSRGLPLIPGDECREPGNVLIISSEDALEQVLKPRVRLAGADLTRVHAVDLTLRDITLPRDIDWLREQARQLDVRLIIIDPIPAVIGASIDTHKDASLRGALRPLHALAEELSLAILGIAHVNKSTGGDVGQRVSGSSGWTNAARSALVWGMPPNSEDGDSRRILAVGKSNYGRLGESYEFELNVPEGEEHPICVLVGETDVKAHDVLGAIRGGEGQTDEATAFVLDTLTDGNWHPSLNVKERGMKEGHSRRTIERAARRIGVEIKHENFPRVTSWRLPTTSENGGGQ